MLAEVEGKIVSANSKAACLLFPKEGIRGPRRYLILGIVLLFAVLFRIPLCTDAVLTSDAADYLRSVRPGVTDVYFERGSVSLTEFIRAYRDPGTGSHLWDYLYRKGDLSALRHFHVPASFYAHALIARATPHNLPHRVLPALIGVLTCILLTWGLLASGYGGAIAAAAGILVGALPQFVLTTTDFSPHSQYIFLTCALLLLSAAAARTKSFSLALMAAMVLALAVCTLELAPALVVTLIIGAVVLRDMLPPFRLRPAMLLFLAFAGCCFVAWPGGFLRGGYAKAYGVFLAQALLKRDEMFGPLTAQLVYARLFNADPLLLVFTLGGIACLAWQAVRGRRQAEGILFGIYAAIAFFLNLGNRFSNDTYASEVLVFAVVAALLGVDGATRQLPFSAKVLLASGAAVLIAATISKTLHAIDKGAHRDTAIAAAILWLPKCIPQGATVVANRHIESFAAYLPHYDFEPTESAGTIRPRATAAVKTVEYIAADRARLNDADLTTLREQFTQCACGYTQGAIGFYRRTHDSPATVTSSRTDVIAH